MSKTGCDNKHNEVTAQREFQNKIKRFPLHKSKSRSFHLSKGKPFFFLALLLNSFCFLLYGMLYLLALNVCCIQGMG